MDVKVEEGDQEMSNPDQSHEPEGNDDEDDRMEVDHSGKNSKVKQQITPGKKGK